MPTQTPKTKVTIRTVADDAGVSVAAVSKVLRDAYGVSDALRAKVLKSIETLGYRPNMAARGMRGKTRTVGILLVEMANPFLSDVIAGIDATLRALNYKTMIGVGEAEEQLETSLIERMVDFQMDGLILISPHLGSAPMAQAAGEIPMVVIGHHEPVSQVYDTVNSDDRESAQMAVNALIARGHRDIMMTSLQHTRLSDHDVVLEREAGYTYAMVNAGLEQYSRIIRLPDRTAQMEADMLTLLRAPDRPTAFYCWSDLHAVPMINLAKTSGIRVPADLAIIGCDDSPPARMHLIDLTSINQDAPRLGEIAARTLLSRIEGRKSPEHILVAPNLVIRSSI
ncbi:LacI family DNA-binding transcriptional regulator [Roseinatronobacter alkalisoli]|uniref:LacI family DNA-binding transcriptional regulator n=1 Tax=Roseinatronobacter alkalisoli TaxID=3028235 RepID=A0ABT5T702_9RHOB|nr:LacI family DNA-binding transcriptional regulator [Roseinatronobacter sp. HJB301]MDD7970905.1 LacI family DNA-binding transcriptional regulator [Roseinatronobacter sp. HJB301]